MLFSKTILKPLVESFRLWIVTVLSTAIITGIALALTSNVEPEVFLALIIGGLVLGLPVLLVLLIMFTIIDNRPLSATEKSNRFVQAFSFLTLTCTIPFLVLPILAGEAMATVFLVSAAVPVSASLSYLLQQKHIDNFFSDSENAIDTAINHPNKIITQLISNRKTPIFMQTSTTLTKGIITALLILVMMIPTFFISNIVSERKSRQQEVVAEVSNKWATAQTVSGYFLYIPYEIPVKDVNGKISAEQRELIILPETATVQSVMQPEVRPRSIYKVLLYKSKNHLTGEFRLQWPKELDAALVHWQDAKICMTIDDIKGIEEKLTTQLNGQSLELSPGLPTTALGKSGLSASLNWTGAPTDSVIAFRSDLALKGSEQLHFLPLAGNSQFEVKSTWPSPSFDGNYLPGTREVNDSGFLAKWSFNKANLPFATHLQSIGFEPEKFAFGVTMVQPADQYAKTERSVKYAILFIGLTFSLFFIIELLQKKPFHPVQYVMVGIALSIFYTLLLSIGEFIPFDYAYLIAATAVVLLISLYAKAHFKSTRTAFIFGTVLTCLYVFTFVLVRLEDTALLIGSIGLFCILALAMYFSRQVNWYGQPAVATTE